MMKRSYKLNLRKVYAFTLVELLVVVSIIALLLAILLPSMSQVRNVTRMAVSLSNMRQIMLGVHAYKTDYKGYVPWGIRQDDQNPAMEIWWSSVLYHYGYVDSLEIFFSPAPYRNHDWMNADAFTRMENSIGAGEWSRTDYGCNQRGVFGSTGNQFHPIRVDAININPSRVLAFAESFRVWNWGASGAWNLQPGDANFKVATWAKGKALAAFLDGAATNVDAEQLMWDSTLNAWVYPEFHSQYSEAPWFDGMTRDFAN